jgi:hypothetical protein
MYLVIDICNSHSAFTRFVVGLQQTTKDCNNSIYILLKRNFDVRAETEFRFLSLEAKLLSL